MKNNVKFSKVACCRDGITRVTHDCPVLMAGYAVPERNGFRHDTIQETRRVQRDEGKLHMLQPFACSLHEYWLCVFLRH
jgi:hypothetical protein